MGLFDDFQEFTNFIESNVETAIHDVKKVIEENLNEAWEVTKELANKALQIIKDALSIIGKYIQQAIDGVKVKLNECMPKLSLVDALDGILSKITEMIEDAAKSNIDITTAIQTGVDKILYGIELTINKSIDLINKVLIGASDYVFSFIKKYTPAILDKAVDEIKELVKCALDVLTLLGEQMKDTVRSFIKVVREKSKEWVKAVGTFLGPIWSYIQSLVRLIFGVEPEHRYITQQWFREMFELRRLDFMSATGNKELGAIDLLIKEQTLLEALIPNEQAWRKSIGQVLSSDRTWIALYRQLIQKIEDSNPSPGKLLTLQATTSRIIAEDVAEIKRVNIFFYRWRDRENSAFSAGLLGIQAFFAISYDTKSKKVLGSRAQEPIIHLTDTEIQRISESLYPIQGFELPRRV